MKVFISYSFKDNLLLKKLENVVKNKCMDFISTAYIIRKRHKKNWHNKVLTKIEKSSIFICILSNNSLNSKNQLWEITKAGEKNKNIIYLVEDDIDLRNFPTPDYKVNIIKLPEIIAEIFHYSENAISQVLFSENTESTFEQYTILINSAEKVIDRRHITNTFFLSANGLLITALSLLTKFNIDNDLSFIYLIFIALIGILLCISWHSLLISYGQLNRGKYKIINMIENKLSLKIFSAEWLALGEGKFKKIYKSFTESEKNIPIYVMLMYIFFNLAIIIFNIVKLLDC